MAPDGACGVAQSTARSNAKFEAERFRKGFRKGFRRKRESVVESNDACSSIMASAFLFQPMLRSASCRRYARAPATSMKTIKWHCYNAHALELTKIPVIPTRL